MQPSRPFLSFGKSAQAHLEVILTESPLRVQRGILEVLRLSGLKNVEVLPYLGQLLTEAFDNLIAVQQVEGNGSQAVDMLKRHLKERNEDLLSLCFHALWINHADMRPSCMRP